MHSTFSSVFFSGLADQIWRGFQAVNRRLPQGRVPSPAWAPGRLLKSSERSKPPLGIPRVTESLCPKCTLEKREAILAGGSDAPQLNDASETIKAYLIEEAGRILLRKMCDRHGPFEDVLSTDPDFFRRMEALCEGHDLPCWGDSEVHHHNLCSVKYGRGGFLIVDLTNRCNMMCNPCFMDANQVGHIHELELADIKAIFERAQAFKPRREFNVLFSGGEPTLSPIFLESVRHARSCGFKRLHVASNGIRFAQSEDFARAAKDAGLHGVYLQFDGVTDQANRHRGVGNLLDVKLQAIENIAKAGMKTTLQSTVINGRTSASVGSIVEFAIQNIDKISHVIFQPIMFSGRDERVEDEIRYQRRYTLSQLAADLKQQTNFGWEPMRDWVPLSAYSALARVLDLLRGPDAECGSVSPASHPDYCVTSPLVVKRDKKKAYPLFSFFNIEQFNRDLNAILDSARGATLTRAQLTLAVFRNINTRSLPPGLNLPDLIDLLRQTTARQDSRSPQWKHETYGKSPWYMTIIIGQFFQDLFMFDLHAIQMSATQVGCQDGEIPFCAYNSAGWRQIVEPQNNAVALSVWKRVHGPERIFAKGKEVPLSSPVSLPILINKTN